MSLSSFILSSLFSLVALLDSNPAGNLCINSTTVRNVTVENQAPTAARNFQWLKERFTGSCGPLKREQLDRFEAIFSWFKSRGLIAQPIEIFLNQGRGYYVSKAFYSLPLLQSENTNLLSRLMIKSLLLQNRVFGEGVGTEIATDLVFTDLFGDTPLFQDWKLNGLGLFGEFSTLDGDCNKNLVPVEKQASVCTNKAFVEAFGRMSPWAMRWAALEAFRFIRRNHSVKVRLDISKILFNIGDTFARDLQLNESLASLKDLNKKISLIFSRLDFSLECYKDWQIEHQQLQVLVSPNSEDIRLAPPMPQNTLILGFNSGFQLVTGEFLQLDETEVFKRVKRMAYISCKSPTVAEILQYSGFDRRLLFIESCDESQPLRLGLFEKFGASGIEHQNPKTRFVQFHQPSVKLAMDWGLRPSHTFGFDSSPESTPEKLRRLFGWNRPNRSMTRLEAPIPIVELFNAKKNESLVLRGLVQKKHF